MASLLPHPPPPPGFFRRIQRACTEGAWQQERASPVYNEKVETRIGVRHKHALELRAEIMPQVKAIREVALYYELVQPAVPGRALVRTGYPKGRSRAVWVARSVKLLSAWTSFLQATTAIRLCGTVGLHVVSCETVLLSLPVQLSQRPHTRQTWPRLQHTFGMVPIDAYPHPTVLADPKLPAEAAEPEPGRRQRRSVACDWSGRQSRVSQGH
jgi:hypothetical protein